MTWNLSQGGMQIDGGTLNVGETVRLLFRLPTSNTLLDVTGSVVWNGIKRQGIRFTHMNPQHEQAIRNFISEVETPDWAGK